MRSAFFFYMEVIKLSGFSSNSPRESGGWLNHLGNFVSMMSYMKRDQKFL